MPGIKRTRSRFGKRPRTTKRKMRRTQSVAVSGGIGVARDQILTRSVKSTLRYKTSLTIPLPGSTDGVGFVVIRANSIYDPEFAIGGGQPRGFDQLSALYGTYQVVGCKIEARFQNRGTGNRPYGFISIRQSGSESPDLKNILEGPDRIVSLVPMAKSATSGDGEEAQFLSMSVKPVEWNGYRDRADADDSKSLINSSPADSCFAYIGAGDPSNDAAGEVLVTLLLTYDVVFTHPKEPTAS